MEGIANHVPLIEFGNEFRADGLPSMHLTERKNVKRSCIPTFLLTPLEKLLQHFQLQTSRIIVQKRILKDYQFEYRAKHSTTHVLAVSTTYVTGYFEFQNRNNSNWFELWHFTQNAIIWIRWTNPSHGSKLSPGSSLSS